MRVLVSCEESQTVCKAFRARGHEAYSCDIQDCSGGHPEWHIKGDVLPLLNGRCSFKTVGGCEVTIPDRWDLIIAHPPCTFLSAAGSAFLFNADHSIKSKKREKRMREAAKFFSEMLNADCKKIAVENPAPVKISGLPPYSQIIEPYMFGEPWKKRTCLWLKGLPQLVPTKIVRPASCWVDTSEWHGKTNRTKLRGKKGAVSAKDRAKTFAGIADAMADQWGCGGGQQIMEGW